MVRISRMMVFLLLIVAPAGFACDMGMHDWQRVFLFDVPLPGPLVMSREIEIINDRLLPSEVEAVIFSASDFAATFWGLISRNYFPEQWPDSLPWQFMPTVEVKPAKIASKSLLLNFADYRLRIMLFQDALSENRCHQLVFMQEGRFRVAMPNAQRPLAEEYQPIAWLSLMYFDAPTLSQIMSLTFSPVRGQAFEIYLNLQYVEYLLNNNLVMRRAQEYLADPEGFPLPLN